MGLFSRKKDKDKEAAGPVSRDSDTGYGIDPIPEGEAAASIGARRKAPSEDQKKYFSQIQKEAAAGRNKSRIATLIEGAGLGTPEMIAEAMKRSGEEAASLGQIGKGFIQTGLVRDEDDFIHVLADQLGIETVELGDIEVTDELVAQIPKKVARDYGVFPVRFDDRSIHVAVVDPMDIKVGDDLERILRKQVIIMAAREDEIERFYKRFYEGDEITKIYTEVTDALHDKERAENEVDLWTTLDVEADENTPPVVKFVDLIFKQAVHDRASDIHIEPNRHGCAIRFRIDGVCHEVPSPPKKWQNAIISRLKVLSGMDLAEKRIPQDGRIKLNLPDRKLDLRVSALPAIYGESIVMRILDQSSVILGLEDVGFLPDNIRIFRELIRTPNGVILMTGPTGSGKTTTLYSALSTLNNPETKIVTIENPVEYMLDGINQVQVNEEVGLDFKTGLRSLLRQSPDVLLVGEIRDQETAEIAIRAALTGHLVFSTLHTNDAPSATTRLSDMGVKPFLVASSVQAVIAQRLVRRLCSHCRKAEFLNNVDEIEDIGASPEHMENGVEVFLPVGCDRCAGKGYRGRTAIHEIFVLDSKIRSLVIKGEPSSRTKKYAVRRGMRTLRMDCWKKVTMGQTSVEEMNRVTASD